MKKILSILIVAVSLIACEDKTYRYSTVYEPVYTSYDEFRSSIAFLPAQSIERLGGLYLYQNYLFLIDTDKGIHFVDNSNPSNPIQTGFLNVPGVTGIEIRNNFMYCNSYIDLVTIDIAALNTPMEVNRIEDVFPLALPVREANYAVGDIDKSKGVVTAFNEVESKEEIDSHTSWGGCLTCEFSTMQTMEIATFDASNSVPTSGNIGGVSGSITKFALVNDHLFVYDAHVLTPFSLVDPTAPSPQLGTEIWREVETLFPHDHYLFMGTTTGMLIYDVQNPSMPTYLSAVNHVQACDPVVVQDDYAYVTIRSNSFCGGQVNQLDIINISDVNFPYLERSFEMNNPHGLGVDGNNLFICDGDAGLKLFDASVPNESGDKLLKRFKNIEAIDIIPYDGHAIIIGENGLFQYDYTDVEDIQLLSEIKI